MSVTKISLGGEAVVTLAAPIGVTQPLTKASTGSAQDIAEIRWESKDGRSYEIEVMAQVLQLNDLPVTAIATSLKWQLFSLGHGSVAYDFPPPNAQVELNRCSWAFPARGLRVRVNARGLIFRVSNNSNIVLGPTVRFSLNPALSGDFSLYPNTDCPRQALDGTENGFAIIPAGAREIRFNTLFVNPAITVNFCDFLQQVIYADIPIASLAEWQALPIDACYWWADSHGVGALQELFATAVYR